MKAVCQCSIRLLGYVRGPSEQGYREIENLTVTMARRSTTTTPEDRATLSDILGRFTSVHATYTRLFADDSGVSRFEDLDVRLLPGFFVPPAEPLHVAQFVTTSRCSWVGGLPDWNGGAAHPAPGRVLFVILQGEAETTAGDGTVRRFIPGSVILVEDTWGTGHSSRVTSAGGFLGLVFTLPDPPE